MKEYAILSIETHPFFARIMKKHSLFLLASLLEIEAECQTNVLRKANHYLRILEQAQEGGKRYGFM